jgi:glycosyltransferase involved in cell wall biosynthesis
MSRNVKKETREQIKSGFEVMSKSRVAICGLARDCKRELENISSQLLQLGNCFQSFSINIVENDSTDGTSEFLASWSADNPNVRAIQFSSCPWTKDDRATYTGQNWWFSEARMQRMNFARNLYLDAVDTDGSVDFVIVIDLDIQSFSLTGIAHSFGMKEKWDFVAGNGRRYTIRHPFKKEVYWDTYVYEPSQGFQNGILNKGQISTAQTTIPKQLSEQNLLAVKSAFGGLCIYRNEAIGQHKYSVIKNNDAEVEVLCDHTTLHRAMAESGSDKGFISTFQLVSYESMLTTLLRSLRNL